MKLLSATSLLGVLLGGCVSTTDPNAFLSTIRSEPMGPGQFMVSCVDSPKYCARESNRLCPSGFDVVSNVANAGDFGRMTMIIKCTSLGKLPVEEQEHDGGEPTANSGPYWP